MTCEDFIPARLSVHDDDYNHDIGMALNIYCDGALMDKVISYDTLAGVVHYYVADENGGCILNDAKDEAVTETRKGRVTVAWKRQ